MAKRSKGKGRTPTKATQPGSKHNAARVAREEFRGISAHSSPEAQRAAQREGQQVAYRERLADGRVKVVFEENLWQALATPSS